MEAVEFNSNQISGYPRNTNILPAAVLEGGNAKMNEPCPYSSVRIRWGT